MNEPRAYLEAVVLQNKLIAIGGKRNHESYNSVESYDFQSSRWSYLKPMNTKRCSFAACTFGKIGLKYLHDRIFVAGGYNIDSGYLQHAEIYSPETNEWAEISPMMEARQRCSAMFWPQKYKLLVVGGVDGQNSKKNICEMYDPVRDVWSEIASLNSHHDEHPACGVYQGKPFVIGNDNELEILELFDERINEWNPVHRYSKSKRAIRRMVNTSMFEH